MRPLHATRYLLFVVALGYGGLLQSQDDPPENRTLKIEVRQTITLEERLGGCEARLAIEYWQKGHLADVRLVVTNEECAASHGGFTVQVRYRDEAGETHRADYPEVWSRMDDQPVTLHRLYPIGDDVDLIRVRSRGLSCACGAAAEPDDAGN